MLRNFEDSKLVFSNNTQILYNTACGVDGEKRWGISVWGTNARKEWED